MKKTQPSSWICDQAEISEKPVQEDKKLPIIKRKSNLRIRLNKHSPVKPVQASIS
jgi:hypothetical protein